MLLVAWIAARRLRTLVCRAKTPKGNPLPERVHEVLPQDLTAGRRVLIVGDLHGCYDELQDLLAKCGYRAGQDMVISVGDLVNKGPDSLAVLRFFAEGGPLVRAVRGNHEEAALSNLRALRAGQAPANKRFAWLQQLDEQLVAYLEQLPLTLRLPSHQVIVVHAGLVPGVPLHRQHILDMVSMRNCVAAQAETGTGSSAGADGSASAAATQAAAEVAQAQARAAALEASGVPLSGSLSSLELGDFELVASVSLGSSSSSSSGGSSAGSSGGGGREGGDVSGGDDVSGGSSSADRRVAYGGRMPAGKARVQSEGLDWRQALLAYAQLGGPRPRAGKAQPAQAEGLENAAPVQQQPQQQQAQQQQAQQGDQAGAAGPAQHPAGEGAAAAGRQQALTRQPRLVGSDKHTLGVPWARAWSEFQAAAPERHSRVTYGCKHAVFGHDARRLLQLERCATGLDGGCVYGNTLYCLLLPPMGLDGQVQLEQAGAPPDAQQIRLSGGVPAFLVGVPARQAYAPTG